MKNEEIDTVETRSNRLTIGMNEDIPLGQAIVLGLQHVLAMDVYVPPFIIATAVAMSCHELVGCSRADPIHLFRCWDCFADPSSLFLEIARLSRAVLCTSRRNHWYLFWSARYGYCLRS